MNSQDILRLTRQMVNRGAPTARDDTGFDAPGFSLAKRVLNAGAPSPKDVYLLAKALVRHPRQMQELGADTAALAAYLRDQAATEAMEVTLAEDAQGVLFVVCRYDEELNAAIKRAGAKFRDRRWTVPSPSAQAVVAAIQSVGFELPAEALALAAQHQGKPVKAAPAASTEFVIRVAEGGYRIEFPYDTNHVAAVKVGKATWDRDGRFWFLPKVHGPTLLAAMTKIGHTQAVEAIKRLGITPPVPAKTVPKLDLSAYVGVTSKYTALREHQHEGVAFMLHKGSCINADSMGLGKSVMSIIASHEKAGKNGRILVVCPSTLRINWMREITGWLGSESGTVQVVMDGKRARTYRGVGNKPRLNDFEQIGKSQTELDRTARWLVVNYDLLKNRYEELCRWANGATVVIVDEVQYIKNDSQRTEYLLGRTGADAQEMAKAQKEIEAGKRKKLPRAALHGIVGMIPHRYALSGTPFTKRNYDLFNPLRLIRHPLTENRMRFLRYFCDFQIKFNVAWFDGNLHQEELFDKLQPVMIQRRKEDVLDLPGKDRQRLYVDIDQRAYEQAWWDFLDKYEEEGRTLNEGAEAIVKLGVMRQAASRGKLDALLERARTLVEQGEKVVIFTSFTAIAQALRDEFGDAAMSIVGGMTPLSRDAAIQRFQNEPGCTVAICNYQAAAVGVTLTAARHVLMSDLRFVPSDHFQAEDRCFRMGQERKVIVQYLIASDTCEETIMKVVDERAAMIELLEAKAFDAAGEFREMVTAIMADHQARFKTRPKKKVAA